MIINWNDLCICGHKLASHTKDAPYDKDENIDLEEALKFNYSGGCSKCCQIAFSSPHSFKIPNLKLLEMIYEESIKLHKVIIRA